MTVPKYLISSFLLLLFTAQVDAYSEKAARISCDNLNVEIKINDSKDGLSVKVTGDQGKVRFFLFNPTGFLINEQNLFQNSFSNLPKGKYKLLVVDATGCNKETELTLQ